MLIIGVAQIVISRVYRCCHLLLLPCRANNWRLLSVFIIVLSGCSSVPTPVVTPAAPLHYVQAETWRSIDEQILNASVSARKKSDAYARVAMDNWRRRVHRRTEEVFIPWYSNYWTQQWMASRVAWYKMQYVEGEPTPEERLTSYLQQQFYEQVLEPVSHFFDPRTVMEEATAVYLREIKIRVDKFPHEYQIPVAELNRHLKFIPAIVVQTIPSQDVSLYDVLKITDLFDLPAYKTLLAQIGVIKGGLSPESSKDFLDRVTWRAVTKFVEQMELRSGASIASFIVGGHLGLFISVGTATWSAAEHENDKSGMEAHLRDNLDLMLEVMWQDLVEDTHGGVTAVVHHMSKQIEYSLFTLDPTGSGLF